MTDAVARPTPAASAPSARLWSSAWHDLRRNPLFVVAVGLTVVFVLMAAVPSLFTLFYPGNRDPHDCLLDFSLQRPSTTHWFGYDVQGCDYYTQTIHGARVSVSVGVLVIAIALPIAVALGTLAAYYGGIVDTIISRFTDMWLGIPGFVGAVVILTTLRDRVVFGLDLGQRGLFHVTLVLAILGWPYTVRLMRAQTAEYIAAARVLGARDLRIIMRHILPNAIGPVIVHATIAIGVVMTIEASLSFLGIGLQRPAISWGLLINQAEDRVLDAPYLLFFPALLLSLAVAGFVIIGDALRDALDPKLR